MLNYYLTSTWLYHRKCMRVHISPSIYIKQDLFLPGMVFQLNESFQSINITHQCRVAYITGKMCPKIDAFGNADKGQ